MDAVLNIAGDTRPVLLLVDGHAYAYRAFYAIRSLNSPTGQPTNAIYGFVKMLQKVIAQSKATHVAVVWDGGLAAARQKALPGYKAQRPEMPADLSSQLDQIVEFLQAYGITSLCEDGVEADDWIARLALDAQNAGCYVVIASADKDFFQLVGDDITLLNPNDKEVRFWSAADVVAKTGVQPNQIIDWLSLLGDAVDNIPGVDGVGPKTAADLLQKFGSIDQIYAQLGTISSERTKKALEAAKADVYRNRELVRLWAELTKPVSLEECSQQSPAEDKLALMYQKWGFKSLLNELEQRKKQAEPLLC